MRVAIAPCCLTSAESCNGGVNLAACPHVDASVSPEFESFVLARGTALLRTAVLLCGGDRGLGKDLLQDVLARVSRRWSRIGDQQPEAYTRAALVNAAHDRRRRRRVTEVPLDGHDHAADADQVARLVLRQELVAALAALPARQRIAVVLRHVEGLSEAETAVAMGCSTGTVKSTASRGTARLRAALAEDDREVR